jgi:hypothetical protein
MMRDEALNLPIENTSYRFHRVLSTQYTKKVSRASSSASKQEMALATQVGSAVIGSVRKTFEQVGETPQPKGQPRPPTTTRFRS